MNAVQIQGSRLELGGRLIWTDLTLDLRQGEFLTVIGPNGAGKTSFLKALLGLLPVSGSITVLGSRPRRGDPRIGYVPQQKSIDPDLPVRGRDLVRMGLDGARWGLALPSGRIDSQVAATLAAVGADRFADVPLGRLSGGEQQRVRIAQALVGQPELLLCDEPLLSLDLHVQREVCQLIGDWRTRAGGTVVFVTHDVNPVLGLTDRVLAFVGGRWALGTPDEVLTSEALSRLYESPVAVIRHEGRVIVLSDVGDPGGFHHEHEH